MISIKYSQIPCYLREGSFFQVLSAEEEDGEIQVPKKCFSRDGQVNTTDDFAILLNAADFWGLSTIPIGLIQFFINSGASRLSQICRLIEADYATITIAQDLCSIFVPATTSMSSNYPLVRAIIINRPEVVYCLAHKVDCGLEATAMAAKHGHLAILQLLHQHGHSWDNSVCKNAAAGGHLECLQYLHDHGCPWDEAACNAAAIGGHVACLKYLHESGCPWINDVITFTAESGSFECIKYAHEQGLEWNYDIAMILCKHGNVNTLRYAIEHGCYYDRLSAYCAVENGHMNCLAYLHEVGGAIDGVALVQLTFEKGYLDCLQFLIEHKYGRLNNFQMEIAATFGHVHIVRYLHEQGCPWDRHATLTAAVCGHFSVLQYLIEQGCECSDDIVCETAKSATESRLQCLLYLLEQRPMLAAGYGELMITAFAYGNYFAVEYLLTRNSVMAQLSRSQRAKFRNSLHQHSQNGNDSNIANCLECALQHNWGAVTEAVAFIKSKNPRFPTCQAVVKKWNL